MSNFHNSGAAADDQELRRAQETLQSDLNAVLAGFLPERDRVSNEFLKAGSLNEALENFDAAVTVEALGAESGLMLTLLYDAQAEVPFFAARRRARRTPTLDEFVAELANQFCGAICQRLPDTRRQAKMSPPVTESVSDQGVMLVIDHVNQGRRDSSALRLTWICAAQQSEFALICLLAIVETGKSQKLVAKELASAPIEEEIAWFDLDEPRSVAM